MAGRRLVFAPMAGHSPADLVVNRRGDGNDDRRRSRLSRSRALYPRCRSGRLVRQALVRWRTMPHRGLLPGTGRSIRATGCERADAGLGSTGWRGACALRSLRASTWCGGRGRDPRAFAGVKAARYELQRSSRTSIPGSRPNFSPAPTNSETAASAPAAVDLQKNRIAPSASASLVARYCLCSVPRPRMRILAEQRHPARQAVADLAHPARIVVEERRVHHSPSARSR